MHMGDCKYLSVCNVLYEYLERHQRTITDDQEIFFFSFPPHLSNQTSKHPYYLDTFQHWFLLFCFTIFPPHLHAPSYSPICCLCHDHSLLQVPSFIQPSNGSSLIDSVLYSLSHCPSDMCARYLKKPIVKAHCSQSNSVNKV